MRELRGIVHAGRMQSPPAQSNSIPGADKEIELQARHLAILEHVLATSSALQHLELPAATAIVPFPLLGLALYDIPAIDPAGLQEALGSVLLSVETRCQAHNEKLLRLYAPLTCGSAAVIQAKILQLPKMLTDDVNAIPMVRGRLNAAYAHFEQACTKIKFNINIKPELEHESEPYRARWLLPRARQQRQALLCWNIF